MPYPFVPAPSRNKSSDLFQETRIFSEDLQAASITRVASCFVIMIISLFLLKNLFACGERKRLGEIHAVAGTRDRRGIGRQG